jgi:hypothetical protein
MASTGPAIWTRFSRKTGKNFPEFTGKVSDRETDTFEFIRPQGYCFLLKRNRLQTNVKLFIAFLSTESKALFGLLYLRQSTNDGDQINLG